MKSPPRWLLLPLAALVAVAGVIGIQVLFGGGTYEPLRPPPACEEREVTTEADGIEGLTERLVLIGLADAACSLDVSREEFVLELAGDEELSDEQIEAVRDGLQSAVAKMEDDGTLPEASELLDEALDSADLNIFLEGAIRALPDSAVDASVKVDDVLDRAIESLDLRELLANLDDQEAVQDQVSDAVTDAVKDSLFDRLKELFPDLPD